MAVPPLSFLALLSTSYRTSTGRSSQTEIGAIPQRLAPARRGRKSSLRARRCSPRLRARRNPWRGSCPRRSGTTTAIPPSARPAAAPPSWPRPSRRRPRLRSLPARPANGPLARGSSGPDRSASPPLAGNTSRMTSPGPRGRSSIKRAPPPPRSARVPLRDGPPPSQRTTTPPRHRRRWKRRRISTVMPIPLHVLREYGMISPSRPRRHSVTPHLKPRPGFQSMRSPTGRDSVGEAAPLLHQYRPGDANYQRSQVRDRLQRAFPIQRGETHEISAIDNRWSFRGSPTGRPGRR